MKQYHKLIKHILKHGERKSNRTGVDTISVFGYQTRFDLSKGFPAVTTKKLNFPSVVSELLWFLEGSDDERRLAEIRYGKPREELLEKKTIWTANADKQGKDLGWLNTPLVKKLGPVYGVQWRNWHGVDQIEDVVWNLRNDPMNRRIILNAWNVEEIEVMALPPCHVMSIFNVDSNGQLNCLMVQRSADVALGTPFNVASYALLTHMLAQVCRLDVGDLVYTIGDAHIYTNQIDGIKKQIKRKPYPLPKLHLNPLIKEIDDFTMDDIRLLNYKHHSPIKMEMTA